MGVSNAASILAGLAIQWMDNARDGKPQRRSQRRSMYGTRSCQGVSRILGGHHGRHIIPSG
jgi:hypothetical protein